MSPLLLHSSGHNVHSILVLLSAILPLSTPHSHPKLQSSPFQVTLSSQEGTKGEEWKGQSLSMELAGESLGSVVCGPFPPETGQGKKPPVMGSCLRLQQLWSPHAGRKGSAGLKKSCCIQSPPWRYCSRDLWPRFKSCSHVTWSLGFSTTSRILGTLRFSHFKGRR